MQQFPKFLSLGSILTCNKFGTVGWIHENHLNVLIVTITVINTIQFKYC